ncbi:tetratricopeptide repeat protein [Longimicrobium sp.]|uniref:tetratricopeptide repeat protein n=1 Tax=Longimicrobium sp. TaxID=2029185 RepID=UPI002E35AF92|nr:tetratricopeptide repeat protein [Longimicrobium sp.]HEX6041442.1 tetratricopeptide repeat protein [Longimicrobium sp.]
MSKTLPPHLLVERALALVPDYEDFLPLSDAVIGASRVDLEKVWARSGAYTTLGKRVVDPERVDDLVRQLLDRSHQRLREMFELVLGAIREQQAGNAAVAAEMLVRAGEMEEAEGRLDKAERIYHMALRICQDLREKEPHVLALRRLGRTARTAGRLDQAWSWYDQSWQLAVDAMDLEGQVIACQGLGNVCDDRGERDRARTWWERGLELAAGLDAPTLEWPLYVNLSVLTMLEGDLGEAERLLGRGRERMERTGAPEARLYWLNNRGLLQLEHGDPAAAEAVFREALPEAEGRWELTLRVNLGEALLRQGRLLEAADEARRAEEVAIVHRLVPDLVDVYTLLGAIARERCDEEGFVFYEQALRVSHERGLPRKTEAAILHGYGQLHAACGRPEEGRGYLEAARDVYRALGLGPELARVDEDVARLEPEPV